MSSRTFHASLGRSFVLACILAVIPWGLLLAQGKGGGGGGGGGHETTAGNNLSFPVVYSCGVTKAVPGTPGVEVVGGASVDLGGIRYWEQQDLVNKWQAQSLDFKAVYPGQGKLLATYIDWGDNLESKTWPETSVIRVETTLYRNLGSSDSNNVSLTPMTTYPMRLLYGEGATEMQGADLGDQLGVVLPEGISFGPGEALGNVATIWTPCARLTLQRINDDADPALLTWNPDAHQWIGAVTNPLFNTASWQKIDGPGGYAGEINVGGKIVYGYVWNVTRLANQHPGVQAAGVYRLTFSLDETCGTPGVTRNLEFSDPYTQIYVTPTEELLAPIAESETGGGGVPVIRYDLQLTYIDVTITPRSGGGGQGGKNNR